MLLDRGAALVRDGRDAEAVLDGHRDVDVHARLAHVHRDARRSLVVHEARQHAPGAATERADALDAFQRLEGDLDHHVVGDRHATAFAWFGHGYLGHGLLPSSVADGAPPDACCSTLPGEGAETSMSTRVTGEASHPPTHDVVHAWWVAARLLPTLRVAALIDAVPLRATRHE